MASLEGPPPPSQDVLSTPSSPPAPIKWSNKREDYELLEVIGSGATSVVQTAIYKPTRRKVAVKRIDLERCGSSMEELQKEISLMSNCNHANVANYYTSFVVKDELWLVMKLMAGGSLLDIVRHVTTKGVKGGVLDEVVIATVLKDVVQGLEYFHANGQIHRDVKAGNILVGEDGSVQLADFGVSNWLYDRSGKGARKKPRNTFVGTPCWMAPEVMDQSVGYNEKADIWSLGITALELATGTAPYAKFPPMKVLMLTLENPPPTIETCGDLNGEDYKKNYSKTFQKMVEKCLQRDPEKRPSATELLKHPFFKKARNMEYIRDVVVGDAPSLASRAKKVRRVPGTSGRLHKTEDGGWVWSDEELMEEYEREEGEGQKVVKEKKQKEPSELVPLTTQPLPTPAATTQPLPTHPSTTQSLPMPSATNQPLPTHPITQPLPTPPTTQPSQAGVPVVQVQPPAGLDLTALQQQRQLILQQRQGLEQQLVLSRQQQQHLATIQQQNPGQFTQDQHIQAMTLLESVQALERQKMQLDFQLQQITLGLQQVEAAHVMQKQFQETLKLQQQQPPKALPKMKLALRKRTETNQLKDIKFDFVPGRDSADGIAKDLIAAGLVDGKNLVVVAANIQKMVENPEMEKLVFPLTASSNVTQGQLDDKKLIGYAQLSVLHDK